MGWASLSFDLNLATIFVAIITGIISWLIGTYGLILRDHRKSVFEPVHVDVVGVSDKATIERFSDLGNSKGLLKKGAFSDRRLRGLESDILEFMSRIDTANQSYENLYSRLRDELISEQSALTENGVLPKLERIMNANASDIIFNPLFTPLITGDRARIRTWLSEKKPHYDSSQYNQIEDTIDRSYDTVDSKIAELRMRHFEDRRAVFQLRDLILVELRRSMRGYGWQRYRKVHSPSRSALTDEDIAQKSMLLAIIAIALTSVTAGAEIFYGLPSGAIDLRTGARVIVGIALFGFSFFALVWLAYPIYREVRNGKMAFEPGDISHRDNLEK